MDILLGLTAAFGWGGLYFVSRFAVDRVGILRTLFYSHLVGLLLLGPYLFFSGELARQLTSSTLDAWLWLMVAATLNTLAALIDLYALRIGLLSIVTPITATYGIITTILAVISGEALSPVQFIGIMVAVAGIALTTSVGNPQRHSEGRRVIAGALWALAAALAYGLAYWITGFFVTDDLGSLIPTGVFRINGMTLIWLYIWLIRRKGTLRLPAAGGGVWRFVILAGVMDAGGTIASFTGYTFGSVAIVTTLASMYTAVTILLATVYLRERLHPRQWMGIAAILIGVILVSAA